MAQVLDVFAEVAEEEDVLFSDFSGDLCFTCQLPAMRCRRHLAYLDVCAVAGSDDQASVQDELHVTILKLVKTFRR